MTQEILGEFVKVVSALVVLPLMVGYFLGMIGVLVACGVGIVLLIVDLLNYIYATDEAAARNEDLLS